MVLRTDRRGVVAKEGEQCLNVTQHGAGLVIMHRLRAENLLVHRGELGHGHLSFFTPKPPSAAVLHTPRSFRKGSCWIPGSYTPCAGLKHLILNGFFQRCRIGRDPRGKPVKTTCYAKLDQLRPWNPI